MTFLEQLLVAINKESLEVVMVGNAAAALQGAPVTTLDVDFIIRDSETNLRKLKAISENLGASLNRPFEPASNMMRMMNHEIQADFLLLPLMLLPLMILSEVRKPLAEIRTLRLFQY